MKALKLAVLGLYAVSLFSFSAHAESWVIHSENEFPPYNYVDQGKFTGLDTEIIELVLSELGIEADYKFTSWQGVVKSVEENTTNLAFQFAPKPERFEQYNMVGPHRVGKTVIATATDNDLTVSTVNDLNGKLVGTVKGYSYTEEFDASKAINKVPANSNKDNITKLANKEIDAMIGDLNTILYLVKEQGLESKIKVLPTTLKEVPRYIAFPKEKVADAKRFEAKLKEVIDNGQVDSIIKKWGVNTSVKQVVKR